MPYDDDGYTKKTETEVMEEKEELYKDLFDIINNSISDVQWQWIKLQLYERMEIETLHEIAAEMMSISTASGAFLDKHGEECGIERKGATNAEGYVELSVLITGTNIIIPAGTQFQSQTNTYISDDSSTIYYEIEMTKTKTGESDDFFSVDVDSVADVVEIIDSTSNIIDSSYYTFDPVYKNNIQWTEASQAVIIENETYYVRVNGYVVKRIEVTSEATGPDSNASVRTVTVCVEYPTLTCTNEEAIVGGADEESHPNYRERLIAARRRTFTLGNIKSIVTGLTGVRSAKVYQCVGTDQTSVADWDNPTRGSDVTVSGIFPIYSQAFVPGDQIATLGKITLYGRPVNDPPAIFVGIKPNIDSIDSNDYLNYNYIEKFDLDPTLTGIRDIEVNVKYNNMDKTKTYRFDVWCDDPANPSFDWSTHHWLLATSTEQYRTDSRGMFYKNTASGAGTGSWSAQGDAIDLMFKTRFNGAGFNVVVSMDDGYGFTNIEPQIETYLDYVDQGGYSPICIQPFITESDEILIDVKGTIYISTLANFQNVRREIITNIETYLENLDVGDNVVYSRIFHVIMDHEQVTKLENLQIKRQDAGDWGEIDLGILDNEIPDLGTRSFQRGA